MQCAGQRAKALGPFGPAAKRAVQRVLFITCLSKASPPTSANRCWAGGTYIRSTSGWSYLAVWMDRFSRRVFGWNLGISLEVSLVLEALKWALGQRQVALTSC